MLIVRQIDTPNGSFYRAVGCCSTPA